MADIAAKNAKNVDAYNIAHVVCIQEINGPIDSEITSCAMNTILLMMATSVPKPRACLSGTDSPLCMRNYRKSKKIHMYSAL